ncbi:MAG: acetylxylan esterase [Prevotella sp.]|nr:acetylxylan esterase [Prevotella sp.]
MKKLLTILALLPCVLLAQNPNPKKDYIKLANYDESKIPQYTLPDVLVCKDGQRVLTKRDWEKKRRHEVLGILTKYMYGKMPVVKKRLPATVVSEEEVTVGSTPALRKLIDMSLSNKSNATHVEVQLYLPRNSAEKKAPVFVGMCFRKNEAVTGEQKESWQLERILQHGYGLATFCYTDVAPDKIQDVTTGVLADYLHPGHPYPFPDEWGSIAAWAWTASRVLDYLETDKQTDATRAAVIGHSRLGKAALWAGATDQRFALTIPVNSGCCGAALSNRKIGETVECVNDHFPYWFNGNFLQFANREPYMPFDQHFAVALCAPRAVYIASASEDNWADQRGEFLGGWNANPVYALYGLKGVAADQLPPVDQPVTGGQIGYHIRTGRHAVLPFDWEQFLLFAQKVFGK